MHVTDAVAAFSSLTTEEKADFLALLAHELTIVARDSYEVGREGLTNPARVRAVNEVQHRVTGFLVALLKNDVKRYPDDVLVNIIFELPGEAGLQKQVAEAFARSLTRLGTAV
jgi:hypothetical protein